MSLALVSPAGARLLWHCLNGGGSDLIDYFLLNNLNKLDSIYLLIIIN
jgi:hypothetical protein